MQEEISLAKWVSFFKKDLNYFLWILGTLRSSFLEHFSSRAPRTQPVGSSVSGEGNPSRCARQATSFAAIPWRDVGQSRGEVYVSQAKGKWEDETVKEEEEESKSDRNESHLVKPVTQ